MFVSTPSNFRPLNDTINATAIVDENFHEIGSFHNSSSSLWKPKLIWRDEETESGLKSTISETSNLDGAINKQIDDRLRWPTSLS